MKKTIFNLRFILVLAVVTLVGLTTRTWAATGTFPTNNYVNTFDVGANTTPFSGSGSVASWLYWYDTPGGNLPMTNDVNTPDTLAGPGAGSLMVDNPFTNGNQNVFFGTFGNTGQYDDSVAIDPTNFDNIAFDVYVKPIDPNTGLIQKTNSDGNFGSLQVGLVGPAPNYPRTLMGTITIPGTATNGWQHFSVPINHSLGDLANTIGIMFSYNNYSGYPTNDFVFWLGHLTMHYNPLLVIPPPTLLGLQKPVSGLNLIDTQPANNYNRYQVETATSTGYSFANHPTGTVTYSWNIKSFPTNSPDGFQQHLFIVNGTPGPYDQAADWNLADCIFITVQEDTNGFGYMDFRYKTNEPQGNGMIFNTATNNWPIQPVGYLPTTHSPLGTWSVTFNNKTNVTLTAPGGETTNFVFDLASANLFADPATVILGAQPNDTFVGGEAVVYSSFSVTGNDSPFTDTFTNDSQLNTNYWTVLASDPNGVVLVPPSAAYWLPWTLPDTGFNLQTNANLADANSWQETAVLQQIQNNTNRTALLGANALPSANQGYYRMIKRVAYQLQVLLPGQTNAPGTTNGIVGTPNPSSYSIGANVPVTVNLCDTNWNVVNVTGDEIYLYSNAGNNFVPQSQSPVVNGSVQMIGAFLAASTTNTITAGDNTHTNILQGTSSIFTTQ